MSIKSLLQIAIVFFSLQLIACNTVYGVKAEHWEKLSEAERLETIKGYNERERIRAEAYKAEQKRRAAEAEEQKLITAWEIKQNQYQPEKTYQHKTLPKRNVIHVNIKRGKIAFKGKLLAYRPLSFDIAENTKKAIIFYSEKGKRRQKIWVAYENRKLWFDIGYRGRRKKHAYVVSYTPYWRKGKHYRNIYLTPDSDSNAQAIEISIKKRH